MLVVWFEANLSCRAFSMSQIDSLDISCMQHLVITLFNVCPFSFLNTRYPFCSMFNFYHITNFENFSTYYCKHQNYSKILLPIPILISWSLPLTIPSSMRSLFHPKAYLLFLWSASNKDSQRNAEKPLNFNRFCLWFWMIQPVYIEAYI